MCQVVYIDTEGTFRPDRIKAIADRFEVDGDSVLENILVARAYNHEQQMAYLVGVAAKMVRALPHCPPHPSRTAAHPTDCTRAVHRPLCRWRTASL